MSNSSSSDSDSDDYKSMRKITIKIKPKDEVIKKGADVNEIKASVEAWRPLGPPVHPTLSRRQSSLSSVSSTSFGAGSIGSGSNTVIGQDQADSIVSPRGFGGFPTSNSNNNGHTVVSAGAIRSSPSCISLVSDVNSRSPFPNIIPSSNTLSRAPSPVSNISHLSDVIPVAIAIQESIELVIHGHYDPNAKEPKYYSRSIGNIKVAFPNNFVKNYRYGNTKVEDLKIRLNSTDNIVRYFSSRLIKVLESGSNKQTNENRSISDPFSSRAIDVNNGLSSDNCVGLNGKKQNVAAELNQEASTTSDNAPTSLSSKLIEFDMDALDAHLRRMYEQTPASRHFSVDVLRYHIAPIESIEKVPLQVCAYWKVESRLVKLRIDFKHPQESSLHLSHFRNIVFIADLTSFIPSDLETNNFPSTNLSTIRSSNNNISGAMNRNSYSGQMRFTQRQLSLIDDEFEEVPCSAMTIGPQPILPAKIPPSPLPVAQRSQIRLQKLDEFGMPLGFDNQSTAESSSTYSQSAPGFSSLQSKTSLSGQQTTSMPAYLTSQPQASWNETDKQLIWRFDNLRSYEKTDGFGSLFAKIDFRGDPSLNLDLNAEERRPSPIEVKFLVVDSTLSKVDVSLHSAGYRIQLLKKEIRPGRYRSEPYNL